MQARIYDQNSRLRLVIVKGYFKDNHFCWKSGDTPILKHIPIINGWFAGIENKIECDVDEVLDDVKENTVYYRLIGDRYEQIPMRTNSMKTGGGVDTKNALLQIELAQARGDAIVQKPQDNPLIGVLFNILIVVLLLGIIYAISNLNTNTGHLTTGINLLTSQAVATPNIIANNTAAIHQLYNWFVVHNP